MCDGLLYHFLFYRQFYLVLRVPTGRKRSFFFHVPVQLGYLEMFKCSTCEDINVCNLSSCLGSQGAAKSLLNVHKAAEKWLKSGFISNFFVGGTPWFCSMVFYGILMYFDMIITRKVTAGTYKSPYHPFWKGKVLIQTQFFWGFHKVFFFGGRFRNLISTMWQVPSSARLVNLWDMIRRPTGFGGWILIRPTWQVGW